MRTAFIATIVTTLLADAVFPGRAVAQNLGDPIALAGMWSCSTPNGETETVHYERQTDGALAAMQRVTLPDGSAAEVPETLRYDRSIATWRLTAPETPYSGGYTLTGAPPAGSDWRLRGTKRVGSVERDAQVDYADAGDDAFRRVQRVRYGDGWRVERDATCRRVASRTPAKLPAIARATDHAYELAGDPFECVTSNGHLTTYAYALRDDGTIGLDEAEAVRGGDADRESYRFDPRARRWTMSMQRGGFAGAAGMWNGKSWTFDGAVASGTHTVPMRVRYVYFDANRFSRAFYAVAAHREEALIWETCRRRPPALASAAGPAAALP